VILAKERLREETLRERGFQPAHFCEKKIANHADNSRKSRIFATEKKES